MLHLFLVRMDSVRYSLQKLFEVLLKRTSNYEYRLAGEVLNFTRTKDILN